MSDDKLLTASWRGDRAKAFLEDEMIQEAFQEIENSYIRAWAQTAPHEFKARENFYSALQILGDFTRHFHKVLQDGKMAKAEIEALAKRERPRAA